MKKVSETGVVRYTEEIGTEGAVMEIRVEQSPEGRKVHAPVKKDGKTLATLSSETGGGVFLSVGSGVTAEEFYDVFAKSAEVMGEILGIKPQAVKG